MSIQALQAEALALLKIETHQQLNDDQRWRLVEISDELWALGSRLPDNVSETKKVIHVIAIAFVPEMSQSVPMNVILMNGCGYHASVDHIDGVPFTPIEFLDDCPHASH